MSQETYLEFLLATSILSAIPGPTATLVVHYALLYGRRAGRYTIPAVILGDATSLTLAFTSVGAFLKLFPGAFAFVKAIGGSYIVYLGISSILSKAKEQRVKYDGIKEPGLKNTFLHVYLVTAFNPKSIIFLLAFFPKYINFNVDPTYQLIILGGTFVGMGGIAVTLYDILAINIQKILANPVYRQRVFYATGALLILIGLNTIIH
jgi:homoserine/homoserine lactone efflux protein